MYNYIRVETGHDNTRHESRWSLAEWQVIIARTKDGEKIVIGWAEYRRENKTASLKKKQSYIIFTERKFACKKRK